MSILEQNEMQFLAALLNSEFTDAKQPQVKCTSVV